MSPKHQPLLHILKQLPDYFAERFQRQTWNDFRVSFGTIKSIHSRLLTVILNVLFNHFQTKNAAQFGQRFQVIHMYNDRSEYVVEISAKSLEIIPDFKLTD